MKIFSKTKILTVDYGINFAHSRFLVLSTLKLYRFLFVCLVLFCFSTYTEYQKRCDFPYDQRYFHEVEFNFEQLPRSTSVWWSIKHDWKEIGSVYPNTC